MKKHFQLTLTALSLSSVFFMGCAHDTVKDAKMTDAGAQTSTPEAGAKDSVSIEAKLAGAQDDTSDVTEVLYDKGSARLSDSYQKKVMNALAAGEKKAPLTHITIVAWSDSEMPKRDQKLPDAEVDLAKVRAKAIEEIIHSTRPQLGIETVNMAEHPGKFKKFLKTNDVRIQQALTDAGTGEKKAGHAVVIIETKRPK